MVKVVMPDRTKEEQVFFEEHVIRPAFEEFLHEVAKIRAARKKRAKRNAEYEQFGITQDQINDRY